MDMGAIIGWILLGFLILWGVLKRLTGSDSSEPGPGMADVHKRLENLPSKVPDQVARWYGVVKLASDRYGLPWEVVLAQVWQESYGDPGAIGSAGEIGLMQLKQVAIDDLKSRGYGDFKNWQTDPYTNIQAGTAYLHLQEKRTGVLADALGQVRADALESYNEGYAGAKRDFGPDEYTNEVLQKAQIIGYNYV